ncbi:MAG: SdrD B-like domain-containing protein, partial [Ghiorsea sp.]
MVQSLRRSGMMMLQHCFSSVALIRAVRCAMVAGLILLLGATAAFAVPNIFLLPKTIASTAHISTSIITNLASNTVIVSPVRTPAVITFLHLNSVTNQYTPADVYHAGQTIYVQVADGDQNSDPTTIQTVTITLTDSISGDMETLTLIETGPSTGEFRSSVPSTRSTVANTGNSVLAVSINTEIVATYQDPLDTITTVAAAALVDPFGLVFDSATGTPINGATVSIINSITGLPALVFGDDGVSAFPSTLITGGSVTDASGAVYNFPAGEYRFPFMNLGTYQLQITPPGGYSFPTQVPYPTIQALPSAVAQSGGKYALVVGSKGENFDIQAGPPLNIDVPLDAKGSSLFVQKTSSTGSASIGDRVLYQISVENINVVNASSVTTINDTLPLGFSYQKGTTTLDGVAVTDPIVAANGRDLTFNVGIVAASTTKKLSYTVVVGSNAKLGLSTNTAFAKGSIAVVPATSNIAQASVVVKEDLIRSKGFIAGVVFVDDNLNELQDEGELGVAGIRIFMEDGRNAVTDEDGRYHFDAVKLGNHVVQMDRVTIQKRYEAVALTQTRFSDNDYSQFADVNGGGLVRANFRLINSVPHKMPVTITHALSEEEGFVWADVDVAHTEKVKLFKLNGFYMLPKGWVYKDGTASVDGESVEPTATPAGLTWKLNPNAPLQHIRLAMTGDGQSGLKQAIAYARFKSPGTEKGRTGLAKLNIMDTLTEMRDQYSFALNVRFKNRKAVLPAEELVKLESLLKTLDGLVVRDLMVEGHTNNIRIAPNHRVEFADNMVLSQARADFIAQYFKEKLQLKDEIVSAIGKGPTEPIYSNNTARGRKLNRRVILKIRADKVTHDFNFELQDRLADAYGEALDDWNYNEEAVKETEAEKKAGIIFPAKDSSLPHAIAAVRTVLDSRLKAELLMDGEVVSKDRIGFKAEDPDTGLTTYTYIGVDFGKTGKHTLQLKGMDSFGNARYDETIDVIRTGEIAKIKLIETGNNVADGKTPIRFKLEVVDNRGVVINGSMELKQLGGDLLATKRTEIASVANEVAQGLQVNKNG